LAKASKSKVLGRVLFHVRVFRIFSGQTLLSSLFLSMIEVENSLYIFWGNALADSHLTDRQTFSYLQRVLGTRSSSILFGKSV